MDQKQSKDQLKALHVETLRTHAQLVKKHEHMVKADKKISLPTAKGTISQEDISNYTKARNEAYDAHKKWAAAQLKYFKFIEKMKVISRK